MSLDSRVFPPAGKCRPACGKQVSRLRETPFPPAGHVFSTCGINVLNSPEYITDGTHPNSTAGYKALGRAIAGGLRTIYPNL